MSDLELLIDVMSKINDIKKQAQTMQEIPVSERDDLFYAKVMTMAMEFDRLLEQKIILRERCQNPSAEFLAWIVDKFKPGAEPFIPDF